jgi:hypothetical protein
MGPGPYQIEALSKVRDAVCRGVMRLILQMPMSFVSQHPQQILDRLARMARLGSSSRNGLPTTLRTSFQLPYELTNYPPFHPSIFLRRRKMEGGNTPSWKLEPPILLLAAPHPGAGTFWPLRVIRWFCQRGFCRRRAAGSWRRPVPSSRCAPSLRLAVRQ